ICWSRRRPRYRFFVIQRFSARPPLLSSIRRQEGRSMAQVVEVCPHDPAWPSLFAALGVRLRDALGLVALRIDHIGSTSVPGLAAKPIIDVHVSVAAFHPV